MTSSPRAFVSDVTAAACGDVGNPARLHSSRAFVCSLTSVVGLVPDFRLVRNFRLLHCCVPHVVRQPFSVLIAINAILKRSRERSHATLALPCTSPRAMAAERTRTCGECAPGGIFYKGRI